MDTQVGFLQDDTTLMCNKMLEVSMARQRIIANNIANADTPNYIRQDFDFDKTMKDISAASSPASLDSINPKIINDLTDSTRSDGNNVVIPKEMNNMMQNSVLHNLMTRAFSTRMSIIRNAITSQ